MHVVRIDKSFCINGQGRCERQSVWISGVVDGESIDFIADEVDLVLVAEGKDGAEGAGRVTLS